jgi:hypothetical protein
MIRELSHARLLGSLRSYFARVEGANGSFMDVATQALGARQYWICMMLSLAAVEEHLMQQGKRCGLVSDKNIIGVEPLKLNDRLSRSGAQDAERSRRTDSLLATTLRMRDSPFEDVRREDAEYMMREANAVVGRPNRS